MMMMNSNISIGVNELALARNCTSTSESDLPGASFVQMRIMSTYALGHNFPIAHDAKKLKSRSY